jgi:WS/DGAT/MGAT family acyltransferase
MHRLSGLDALFLNMETEAAPTHVAGLLILDPSDAPGFGFEAVRSAIERRLHLVPSFRRRLIVPPLNLIRPFWIEDPEFSIARHVRRTVVPRPGSDHELAELVAQLIEKRLDRSRPLWQVHYIEGLPKGRVAVLSKIHHACIDGISGAELLAKMLDLSPQPVTAEAASAWRPELAPSPLALGVATLRSLAAAPRELARLVRETRAELFERRQQREPAVAPAVSIADGIGLREIAPRTRFNTLITADRVYAFGSLPMDPIKRIKDTYKVTANDVVMTVCSEALRRYLKYHRDLPAQPLIAAVPVSFRQKSEYGEGGNRIVLARVNLATDTIDPVERLQAIGKHMGRVKQMRKALPAKLMMKWINTPAPALFHHAARLYEALNIQDYFNPPFNLIISNVTGPRKPLYFAGAKVLGFHPVSIVYHGVAFNITLFAYCDSVNIGLTAHRQTLPDIDRFLRYMSRALADMDRSAGRAQLRSNERLVEQSIAER